MYWQDWVLLIGLAVVLATVALTGCGSAEPTLAPPRVLVFTAPWCPFCPSESQITRLMVDFPNAEICPINVDHEPELVKKYRVTKIPLFILCDADGCRVTRNLEELRCWLTEHPSL